MLYLKRPFGPQQPYDCGRQINVRILGADPGHFGEQASAPFSSTRDLVPILRLRLYLERAR